VSLVLSQPGEDQPKHAKHGPSKLRMLELCPSYEDDPTSDKTKAERGTAMHLAVERGDDSHLDVEEAELVQTIRNYTATFIADAEQVFRELRLQIAGGETWGTCDLFCVKGDRADLIDYKTGAWSVEPAAVNLQAQAYVLGAFERFPQVQWIRVHLILPRRDEITTAEYQRSSCVHLWDRVTRTIERAEREHGHTFRPSDKACFFCGAKAKCPALSSFALAVAPQYEKEYELPAEYHASLITDPAQMSKAMMLAQVLGKWVDSVKHHALELALSGVEIPGYQIRERAAPRKITDVVAAYIATQSRFSLTEFLSACTLTVSGLTEAAASKAAHGQKTKEAAAVLQDLGSLGIALREGETIKFLSKTRT
jgi:hypothetical protein